jgi:molecular chaperone GrpE
LHTALESRGLKRIESVGKAFDPNFHESAALTSGKEDMVVEEIKPGYCLYDRVIRPCTVMVGNGQEATCPEDSSGKKSKTG